MKPKKYSVLALPLIRKASRQLKPLIRVSAVLILLSLLFFRDEKGSVLLLGWLDWSELTVSSDRNEAFSYLFYDLYSTWWLLAIVFCIYSGLLLPLNSSFSVNQHLWLRMLPEVRPFDVALSKVYTLFYSVGVLVAVSVVWALLYALLKGGEVLRLLIPTLGLVGYIFLSSGLLLSVSVFSPNRYSSGRAVALLFTFFPAFLYFIGRGTAVRVNGYFPYAMPFANKYYEHLSLRPFLTAAILGLALMGIYLFKNYRITSSL